MKIIRFLFTFAITFLLTYSLNSQFQGLPPLGKFLDPFNGFWQNASSEVLNPPPYTNLENLHNDVTVKYDSLRIPHIYAQNDHDLYFMQGYLTAKDRLWQMEFQTHFAAGRLSEIFGKRTLPLDRKQRRSGLVFGAEKKLQLMLKQDTIATMVKAYAEGVNTYIQSLDYKSLPLEYKLLNYRPEQWTPLKTALLLQYMADNLSGKDNDLKNTNALQFLGKEKFSLLFPERFPDDDPIIQKQQWGFSPERVSEPGVNFPLNLEAGRSGIMPVQGSNNWAIAGSKTSTKGPILANDPHLELSLPSTWYLLHQQGPGVNVMGATLPGAPGVIIGFNDSIAWGVTNAPFDVRDWYKINFDNEDKTEYRFDSKLLKTQTRVETIKVKDAANVSDTMIYTHLGPIVYDKNYTGQDSLKGNALKNYSLRWTAHDASSEQLAFYKLNRAQDYQEFKNALPHYKNPAQNFAFASANDNIAMHIQGKLPLKWKNQGKFLMDGSKSQMEWDAFIPQSHLPRILNPARGFVSSANQKPVGDNYPYNMPYVSMEHFRNRRINQILSQNETLSPENIMNLQQDNYNMKAEEILPFMLDSINQGDLNERQDRAFELLNQWNYHSQADKKAPGYFNIWFEHLYDLLWDEFQGNDMTINRPSHASTIHFIKNHPHDSLINIQNTSHEETLAELINESFKRAVKDVEAWTMEHQQDFTWSNFKATSVMHLAQLSAFSEQNINIGGGKNIINANSHNHGVSLRMVVAFKEEGVQGWGIYPGGQSGNPGSPYYNNMIDSWKNGDYIPLKLLKAAGDNGDMVLYTQQFSPESRNKK